MQDLDITKNDLAEKDRLLRNRDTLLENTGMESRRLADLLERERQGRRQDQNTYETVKRGHQTVSKTVQQHETRVLELETLRSQDRQRLHGLEKQYKEQLLERNNLLYALWNRLSTLCGGEWCRNNALVNGELTSMELISKNIQGFNKNMILAVKTVEGIIGGFKIRIRAMEKDPGAHTRRACQTARSAREACASTATIHVHRPTKYRPWRTRGSEFARGHKAPH
jgi:hypothetical protein